MNYGPICSRSELTIIRSATCFGLEGMSKVPAISKTRPLSAISSTTRPTSAVLRMSSSPDIIRITESRPTTRFSSVIAFERSEDEIEEKHKERVARPKTVVKMAHIVPPMLMAGGDLKSTFSKEGDIKKKKKMHVNADIVEELKKGLISEIKGRKTNRKRLGSFESLA